MHQFKGQNVIFYRLTVNAAQSVELGNQTGTWVVFLRQYQRNALTNSRYCSGTEFD